MIISITAITGTPGSGKTAVARLLRKKGYKVIDLKRFAVSNGCVSGIDSRRNTREIDVPKLNRLLKPALKTAAEGIVFIEGHLSHLLDFADVVVVLRCAPSVLVGRLRRKRWRGSKVRENIQAEALGIITFEAMELRKSEVGIGIKPNLLSDDIKSVVSKGRRLNRNSVFELDSTNAPPDALASAILEIAAGKRSCSRYRAGRISWSKDIMEHREILNLIAD